MKHGEKEEVVATQDKTPQERQQSIPKAAQDSGSFRVEKDQPERGSS